jgi:probable FeS assembly SUF system protein SufT
MPDDNNNSAPEAQNTNGSSNETQSAKGVLTSAESAAAVSPAADAATPAPDAASPAQDAPPSAEAAADSPSAESAAAAVPAAAASNDRVLKREVTATTIPAGTSTLLPAGTSLNIANRLGGNFTVVCDFGMFRISGNDADAIGEPPPPPESIPKGTTDATGSCGTVEHPGHSGAPGEAEIWEQLKTVFDPEIPVNIVDLGLVYSLKISAIEGEADKHRAEIAMTLTAPGCGMGPVIAEDARNRVLSVPGVHEARVDIVWEPPWTSDMISEDGKMELGLV